MDIPNYNIKDLADIVEEHPRYRPVLIQVNDLLYEVDDIKETKHPDGTVVLALTKGERVKGQGRRSHGL